TTPVLPRYHLLGGIPPGPFCLDLELSAEPAQCRASQRSGDPRAPFERSVMAGRKKTPDAQLAFGGASPAVASAPVATTMRLHLVDASAYIYRAFHAVPFLSTSRGVPTNAAYGVTAMLLKLLREERPTHLGLVFDAPGGSFRDELYAEYKANRSAMPDELVPQLGLIRRLVETLRARVLEVPGVEADDVIGTLATRVAAAG